MKILQINNCQHMFLMETNGLFWISSLQFLVITGQVRKKNGKPQNGNLLPIFHIMSRAQIVCVRKWPCWLKQQWKIAHHKMPNGPEKWENAVCM